MSASFENELRVARRLAREAGTLLLEVYGRPFDVVEKANGGGPVTEADERANAHIVAGLREAFPEDGVIAEESDNTASGAASARCWYVDPLDGTAEFVQKNGMFAVHIGLAVNGEAAMGVVYRPVGDKLYAGVVGGECVLEEAGTLRRLHVTDVSDPTELRLVVSRSHRSEASERMRVRLGITRMMESGSVGLKCGLLAEGVADVYLHASDRSYRWDSCAPEAVLRAAGGVFRDVMGQPFTYDRTNLRNERGILASNAAAFPKVAKVAAEVAKELDAEYRASKKSDA